MIAKTLTGLEGVLASELSALGAENVTPQNRAVEFEGNTELMYKINLWSRTALSILKPVFDFTFETQEQYYEILRAYAWDDIFDVDKTIAINAIAFNSEFTNSLFLAQRTKDAVADYFTEKTGKRPSVDLEDPQIKINIYINGDMCSVSLDSSGAPLFKRGYRRKNVQAPLNEVLAAGLIMLSGWDKKKPFYDPMCGSATFSIEAAMMALNMAPSIFRRHFSFQHWKDYDPELWESLREQARKQELKRVPPIIASDINNNAMDAARTNLMEAGLLGRVKLEKKDFFTSKPTHTQGMLILNPPYGLRLQTNDIHDYYKEIGTALKHNFTGFDAWIISPDKALTHKIGLRHTSQTMVYNGQLECRFLGYELYEGTKKTHKTDSDSSENQPEEKEKHLDGQPTEKREYDKRPTGQDEPWERKPFKRTAGKKDNPQERKPYKRSDSNKDNPEERKPYRRSTSGPGYKSERKTFGRSDSNTDNTEERKPYRRSTSGPGYKPDRKPYGRPDSNKDNPEERKPFRRSTSGPGHKPDRKPYGRSDSNSDNPEERKPFRRSTSGPGNKPERKSYGRSDSNKDNPEERKPFRSSTSRPGNKPERKPYVQREDRSDHPRDKKPYGERDNKNKGYKGEGSAFKKEGNRPYKREENKSEDGREKRSFRKQESRPEKRGENKADRPFKKKDFKRPDRRNEE